MRYAYDLESTANGTCDAYRLQLMLQGAGLPVVSVSVGEDIYVETSVELTTQEQSTAQSVVAAHDGSKVYSALNHMSVSIRTDVLDVQNDDWPSSVDDTVGMVGCITSKPDFFGPTQMLLGQVLGSKKVVAGPSGQLPEVRIVQRNLSTGVETVALGPVQLTATTGFAVMNIVSNPGMLGSSYNEFFVQARRNGAAELKVRGVSCAVIELV